MFSVCSVLGPGVSSSGQFGWEEEEGKASAAAAAAPATSTSKHQQLGASVSAHKHVPEHEARCDGVTTRSLGGRQGDGRSNGAEAGRRTERSDSDHRARGQGECRRSARCGLAAHHGPFRAGRSPDWLAHGPSDGGGKQSVAGVQLLEAVGRRLCCWHGLAVVAAVGAAPVAPVRWAAGGRGAGVVFTSAALETVRARVRWLGKPPVAPAIGTHECKSRLPLACAPVASPLGILS